MGFGVWGLGFGIWGLGFRDWDTGILGFVSRFYGKELMGEAGVSNLTTGKGP